MKKYGDRGEVVRVSKEWRHKQRLERDVEWKDDGFGVDAVRDGCGRCLKGAGPKKARQVWRRKVGPNTKGTQGFSWDGEN